jgi:hypothetical protein
MVLVMLVAIGGFCLELLTVAVLVTSEFNFDMGYRFQSTLERCYLRMMVSNTYHIEFIMSAYCMKYML